MLAVGFPDGLWQGLAGPGWVQLALQCLCLGIGGLLAGWSVWLYRGGRCRGFHLAVCLLTVAGGSASVVYMIAAGEPFWETLLRAMPASLAERLWLGPWKAAVD